MKVWAVGGVVALEQYRRMQAEIMLWFRRRILYTPLDNQNIIKILGHECGITDQMTDNEELAKLFDWD